MAPRSPSRPPWGPTVPRAVPTDPLGADGRRSARSPSRPPVTRADDEGPEGTEGGPKAPTTDEGGAPAPF
eukprot:3791495-Pyramimonas_sp.AAC.3